MSTGLHLIILKTEFLLALSRCGSLLLRTSVGIESVYGHATLGSILVDDAVDLGLGFGRDGCTVYGSHEGREEEIMGGRGREQERRRV